jgi:hypothetical protein
MVCRNAFYGVSGDMGSEGAREQLLGASDLDDLLQRIRRRLGSTLINDPPPSADDLGLALTLLLRTQHATPSRVNKSIRARITRIN